MLFITGLLFLALSPEGNAGRDARPSSPDVISLGVVGDSTSHSYQDQLSFPPGSPGRGGALRANTYQWTEVIARLRGKELDLGPWVDWGRHPRIAEAREFIGLDGGRASRKQDYLFNFANSGARCDQLVGVGSIGRRFHQVPRLIAVMNRDPERWKKGVVVIRMGVNDWEPMLDLTSREPDAPKARSVRDFCTGEIRKSVERIHASHPSTRVVVVGILNDSDDPFYNDHWLSVEERANIKKANALFNDQLRKLVASLPNTAFFDDAAWCEAHWGTHGSPTKPVVIGKTFAVTNTVGDDPHNAGLADHHSGLVWNVLWAQSLVDLLRKEFQLPLTPISDEDVAAFVLPLASRRPGEGEGVKAPGS